MLQHVAGYISGYMCMLWIAYMYTAIVYMDYPHYASFFAREMKVQLASSTCSTQFFNVAACNIEKLGGWCFHHRVERGDKARYNVMYYITKGQNLDL